MQYRTVATENSGNMKAYAEELLGSPINGVPYVIMLDLNGVISGVDFNPSDDALEALILDVL